MQDPIEEPHSPMKMMQEPLLKYPSSPIQLQDTEPPSVSFMELFQYAKPVDVTMMIIGTIFAIANGCAIPAFAFTFGSMTNDITTHMDDLMWVARKYAIIFLSLGGITLVLSYISMSCWMITGERQGIQFRIGYFQLLLRQEIAWYDKTNPIELSTKVANDCTAIQSSLGEKISTALYAFTLCLASFFVAFIRGWELALILTGVITLSLIIVGAIYIFGLKKASTLNTKAYETAGGYAEQAFTAIRTVKSLNGEEKELKQYSGALEGVKKVAIKYGAIAGYAMGFIFFLMIFTYGLGFYLGSRFVENGYVGYTSGNVVTIFFSITIGTMMISQMTPIIKAFAVGKQALNRYMWMKGQVPLIDVYDKKGLTLEQIEGDVEFKNVYFTYPNRQRQTVLRSVNIKCEANKKTALIGESGSGKSTCIQLIERFYDVERGSITIDGVDIKDISLKFLRNSLGYVGQEPVLFNATIKENLLFAKEDATDEELKEATEKAKAYEFISKLPNGFDTYVGPGGASLSGGQKQRIAIARVILKKSKILLLDEATSALDRKVEAEIQATLDELTNGRTTIIIAHRLSTIMNAHKIVMLHEGQVVDQGTHDELMVKNPKYRQVAEQSINPKIRISRPPVVNEREEHENPFDLGGLSLRKQFSADTLGTDYDRLSSSPTLDNKRASVETVPENFTVDLRRTRVETPRLDAPGASKNNGSSIYRSTQGPESTRKNSNLNEVKPEETYNTSGFAGKLSYVDLNFSNHTPDSPQLKDNSNKSIPIDPYRDDRKYGRCQIIKRLFTYNRAGICTFFFCLVFSAITGMVFPVFAIIFSRMLNILNDPNNPEFNSESNTISLQYLIIGGVMFLSLGSQIALSQVIGESLTRQIRKDLYKKMLSMDIAWFDLPTNSPGVLSAKLSTDPHMVNGLISSVLSISVQAISSLIVGIVIAFFASWRVTLVTFGATPLVLVGGYIFQELINGFSQKNDGVYKESSGFLTDMITNMRTVASFGNEDFLIKKYTDMFIKPMSLAKKRGIKAAISFGFAQFSVFLNYAIVFYAGIYYLNQGDVDFQNMYQAVFALIFAAFGSGSATQFMPDVGNARKAATNIFNILDTPNLVISSKNKPEEFNGKIEFKNVVFQYPTRENLVLRKLNFTVNPGEKVAFVGPSGCGKSTVLQLLLRFYDIKEGEILIDGKDIKDIDIQYLRSQLGLVSQEPVLFNCTIRDNIRYSRENATEEEIKQAATISNAIEFIEKDDMGNYLNHFCQSEGSEEDKIKYGAGFNRVVGPKGSQLSGGQKQRIAIARSVLKDPKVFLFDEATSALDNKNEQIVQESLDRIIQRMTSITIAHRFSTIQNSDKIYVFLDGEIVEEGNYQSLLNKQGIFYRLEKGLPIH